MTFEKISELITTNQSFRGSDIDTVNGFLYVASNVVSGKVTKVRLSDFTENAILTITSAVATNPVAVDVPGGFLYVGADSVGKIITKIRLSDFTEVTTKLGTNPQYSVCKDLVNGFIYFGESVGRVDKINLSTFALTNLNTGVASTLNSAVIDEVNGYAYFGAANSTIVRVRLSDFTAQGTIAAGIGTLFGAVIDTVNGFAYFAGESSPGRVVKIKLSDFTLDSTLNVTPDNWLDGGVIDVANKFAYFYGFTSVDTVVQIDLTTFARNTDINITTGNQVSYHPSIDLINKFAYFPLSFTNKIIKIGLTQREATATGRSNFRGCGAMVFGGIEAGKGKERRK